MQLFICSRYNIQKMKLCGVLMDLLDPWDLDVLVFENINEMKGNLNVVSK